MSNDTRLQAALTSNIYTKEMILSDQVKTSKVGALQTYDISLYIKSCCQRDLQNKDVSKCCQRKCSRTHDYTRCTPVLHTDHSDEIFSSSHWHFQDDIFTIEHYKLCCISALHTDQVGSSLFWSHSPYNVKIIHHDQPTFLFCIKILFQRLQLWSLRDSPTHMAVQGQDDGNTPFGS